MKVLFVAGGNSKYHNIMPAFIRSQADSLIEMGIELDFYQIKGKGIKGYLKSIIPLRRFLGSKNYEIIHAHFGFCGVVSALARRKEKLVVSFMGESELAYDKDADNKIFAWLMPYVHKFFAVHIFDHIIFKSENLKNYIKPLWNSSIVPNGVNIEKFQPTDKSGARRELGIPEQDKIILWIGNKTRTVKGFNIADKAVSIVKNKISGTQFLPLNNIDNTLLSLYYNAADLFLLSSISEGSPNVIKEAMACNCPIVTTPVGDVAETIGNTRNCFISKSWEPKELGMLMLKILENPICTDGRSRIVEKGLSTENVANRIISIYTQLLHKGNTIH